MIKTTLKALCGAAQLREAWDHVDQSDRADGQRAPSMVRFADQLDERLHQLAEDVRTGRYRPRPLAPVTIPKDDGSRRELQIPSAPDRVVERALLVGLQRPFDRHLSPTSFGYRPGLGVADAVRRLVELREDGWVWVVRTDIDECFPSIDRNRLLLRLEQLIADPTLLDVIAALIQRPVGYGRRQQHRTRGIPQGGSLSPLLANLLLDDVDQDLLAEGHQVVRYADDLVILARSATAARQALGDAIRAAERNGFTLSEDKTMAGSYEEGFYFLGEEFNLKYPPPSSPARAEPTSRSLYVGVQGAGVRIHKGRLIVSRDDHELLSVPTGHVARIVLSGSVGLSAGARSWALYNDVDVVLLARRGSFLGTIDSGHADADMLRAQLAAVDTTEMSLKVAQSILAGKLRNQRTLLQRLIDPNAAEQVGTVVADIDALAEQLDAAPSLDVALGIEGMASRRYWDGLRALLPDVGFVARQRRPPPDLVNSALGFGYAILLAECVSACHGSELHPSFGFLHRDAGRRPSLALDLMEEFRPLIVDQVVTELVRRRSLTTDHVRTHSGGRGVLLTDKGRRRLLAGLEDRLLTVALHLGSGHRVSYRRSIQLQAAAIARTIRHGEPYEAVLWR